MIDQLFMKLCKRWRNISACHLINYWFVLFRFGVCGGESGPDLGRSCCKRNKGLDILRYSTKEGTVNELILTCPGDKGWILSNCTLNSDGWLRPRGRFLKILRKFITTKKSLNLFTPHKKISRGEFGIIRHVNMKKSSEIDGYGINTRSRAISSLRHDE